jgi:hypothetical protein
MSASPQVSMMAGRLQGREIAPQVVVTTEVGNVSRDALGNPSLRLGEMMQ